VTAGEYTLGHNAEPELTSHRTSKELDPSARLIDDLSTVAPRATNTELRGILGCSFSPRTTFSKPSACSPAASGNRYALARMLMVPSNFSAAR